MKIDPKYCGDGLWEISARIAPETTVLLEIRRAEGTYDISRVVVRFGWAQGFVADELVPATDEEQPFEWPADPLDDALEWNPIPVRLSGYAEPFAALEMRWAELVSSGVAGGVEAARDEAIMDAAA